MSTFIAGETYVLNYNWTPTEGDNKGIPQHAVVPSIFTGKIYLINKIEFGEFQHISNKKLRPLSKEMLSNMVSTLAETKADGEEW
tara:strand:- start:597 stop:851 length:255 start_codon:yes stop_codon:yes gene_type:complete